jgi:GT2 family glycosyltransferase
LCADTVDAVSRFASETEAAIGYCRLRFGGDGPWLAGLNALGANLRSRLLKQPYGDQGLCMPKEAFDRLEGFREDLRRGEDLDFIVRAGMAGIPVRPVGATITTSARRYREQGWLRTTWRHQLAAVRLIRNARRSVGSDHP